MYGGRRGGCRGDPLQFTGTITIEKPSQLNARTSAAAVPAPRFFLFLEPRFSDLFLLRDRGDDGRQYRARHQLLGDLPEVPFAGFSGALADGFDIRRLIQLGMLMLFGVSVCWGVMFLTDSVAMWKAMLLGASVGNHNSLSLSAAALFVVIATMFVARGLRDT